MKTRQKEGKKFTKVKRRKNHRTRPSNSNSNVHILEQPVSLLVAEAPSLGTGCFSTTAFDLEAPFRSSYFFKRQVECFDSVSFFVAPRYNCKSIPSFGVEHYLWPRFVVEQIADLRLRLITYLLPSCREAAAKHPPLSWRPAADFCWDRPSPTLCLHVVVVLPRKTNHPKQQQQPEPAPSPDCAARPPPA